MKQSFDLFLKMLAECNGIRTVYEYLENKVHAPVNYSDLLRWQWIQAVSTLDKFIHDIVRIGILEIYTGVRISTQKYQSFPLSLEILMRMKDGDVYSSSKILENQILAKHSFLAFQDPDKISDALSYIWNEEHKWQCISNKMNISESSARKQLRNISIRRNQIVHEGDYSNELLQRQEMIKEDVNEVVSFIRKIGENIYFLIKI